MFVQSDTLTTSPFESTIQIFFKLSSSVRPSFFMAMVISSAIPIAAWEQNRREEELIFTAYTTKPVTQMIIWEFVIFFILKCDKTKPMVPQVCVQTSGF